MHILGLRDLDIVKWSKSCFTLRCIKLYLSKLVVMVSCLNKLVMVVNGLDVKSLGALELEGNTD